MKKILFISFVIFLFLSQYIIADENEDFVKQTFKELDINKDGIIDKNDIQKFSKKEFEIMDKNNDGLISKDEFVDFVCKKSCTQESCNCKTKESIENFEYIQEYWKKIDKNSDNQITFQEKLNGDLDNFYTLDANKDEKVTRDEVEAQLY